MTADLRFLICHEPQQVQMAQALRYEVYCREKAWVDAERCPDGLEADEYDDLALHFLALEGQTPVGTSRLLLGDRQQLPAAGYLDLEALGLRHEHLVESRVWRHVARSAHRTCACSSA